MVNTIALEVGCHTPGRPKLQISLRGTTGNDDHAGMIVTLRAQGEPDELRNEQKENLEGGPKREESKRA